MVFDLQSKETGWKASTWPDMVREASKSRMEGFQSARSGLEAWVVACGPMEVGVAEVSPAARICLGRS